MEFKKYPPDKYPIKLHLMFSRRDACLADELKSILNGQSNEESRYRKTVAKHVGNGVTMRCYFKDVDSLRPVVWKLDGKNIWHDTLQYDSQKLTPRMLIEKAKTLLTNDLGYSV